MKLLISISFILLFSIVQAQPRIISFDSEQEEAKPKEETNVIKLHPLEFLSNDYSLYYEKALLNILSAEIGLGFTYGDYWGEFSSDKDYYLSKSDNKLGFSFAGSLRFYPFELFEDFYIAAEYKFRKYNWEREVEEYISINSIVTKQVDESRIHSMPRLTLGYVFYLTDQFSLDLHLGIGVNTIKEKFYNNTKSVVEEVYPGAKPRMNGGIKIGYLF